MNPTPPPLWSYSGFDGWKVCDSPEGHGPGLWGRVELTPHATSHHRCNNFAHAYARHKEINNVACSCDHLLRLRSFASARSLPRASYPWQLASTADIALTPFTTALKPFAALMLPRSLHASGLATPASAPIFLPLCKPFCVPVLLIHAPFQVAD